MFQSISHDTKCNGTEEYNKYYEGNDHPAKVPLLHFVHILITV